MFFTGCFDDIGKNTDSPFSQIFSNSFIGSNFSHYSFSLYKIVVLL